MKSRPTAILILAIIAGLLAPMDALAQFSGFPDEDFVDEEVILAADLRLELDDDPRPTSIDWLPDGDLLVITQQGGLFRGNGTNVVELLDLSQGICSFNVSNEMGLLGLAVDPDFSGNTGNVFLYYTDRREGGRCANRVSKFTLDLVDNEVSNEEPLIDNIPAPGGNHNGGDLQFGRDGLLYVSVGDGGEDLRTGDSQDGNRNARRRDLLNGKILRITPNGGIPAGNPFQGPGTARCASTGQLERDGQRVEAEKKSKKQKRRAKKRKRKQRRNREPATICREIFATGLRNPYRIAFDPDDSNRFYINDVGGDGFEEVNEGARGMDYGWNLREGPCPINNIQPNCSPDSRFEDPVFAYRRLGAPPFDGCRTITGGAFVPNVSNWPGFEDAYLFADLFCGRIFALHDDSPGETPDVFASGEGATHLVFGPDGDLYYTAFFDGEIHKIVRSN
ncbi:MAG: PQQ-dependent sugar dehydrogenase [Thermomicrobiales bacterium]